MLRKLILGAGLAAAATCAAAQPPRSEPYPPSSRGQPPARELVRARDTLDRVLDALMDVRIGPVVDAVDPAARYDRYRPETVGDLATRNDPYARERLHADVARTTAGMGAVAQEVAVLAPALRRSIDDARRRMAEAMAPYDAPPR
jgi:hypothetical protein